MVDSTVVLSHLAFIFGLLGVILAGYVLVEQTGLRKTLTSEQRKREKTNAKFLQYDIYEPLLDLEKLDSIEKEIAVLRIKGNLATEIQNKSNAFSDRQEEVKEKISKINKVLLLIKEDVNQNLFEEVYWLIKELERWNYNPITPVTTTVGVLSPFPASYYLSRLKKVYDKLEKIIN